MLLRTPTVLLLMAFLLNAVAPVRAQDSTLDPKQSPALAKLDSALEKLDEAVSLKADAESPADLAKVIELCEKAIEMGLDEGNLRLAKQLLAATALQRAQMTVQRLPQVANNLNAVRNLSRETMKDLQKAVENNPQLAEAFILMAKLETLPGGSRERALEQINKAIDLLGDKPVDQSNAYILRAGLQEDNEAKLADLGKAIEVNPTNTDALQAKIAIQLALGKLQEVVADAEQMMAKDEDNLFAFEAAIRAMVGLEKNDEAIELLTKRIDKPGTKDETKSIFYRMRAQVQLLKKNDQAALSDLDQALELNHRDAEALVMRGRIHYLNEDFEKANRDISDALLVAPDSVEGVLMRGLVAAQEQRYGDAIADMEMLVRADPNNVDWIMQLASYYQMDNRPRKAIELLDLLVKKNKDEWRAMRLRGDAKLSIGMHHEAVADYDQAIRILEESRAVAEDDRSSDVDYSGLLNNLSWVLSTSPQDGSPRR